MDLLRSADAPQNGSRWHHDCADDEWIETKLGLGDTFIAPRQLDGQVIAKSACDEHTNAAPDHGREVAKPHGFGIPEVRRVAEHERGSGVEDVEPDQVGAGRETSVDYYRPGEVESDAAEMAKHCAVLSGVPEGELVDKGFGIRWHAEFFACDGLDGGERVVFRVVIVVILRVL